MFTIKRSEMNDPEFKENTNVFEIQGVCKETKCCYEIEDGKIARLIINESN